MADREKVIKALQLDITHPNNLECAKECPYYRGTNCYCFTQVCIDAIELLKDQEPDASKYQYKNDHTDCIWYSDSESRCPVTCSQYRDGWNDAMDFIFKNGVGYSPYKRR